jgi:hypothetical protein
MWNLKLDYSPGFAGILQVFLHVPQVLTCDSELLFGIKVVCLGNLYYNGLDSEHPNLKEI